MHITVIPHEIIREAEELRASCPRLWNWKALGRRFGYHHETLRRRLDPEFDERVRKQRTLYDRAVRAGTYCSMNVHSRVVPALNDAELKRRKQLIPEDTRDLTARFFGDPIRPDPRRPWLR
jgi:hypothetical protein